MSDYYPPAEQFGPDITVSIEPVQLPTTKVSRVTLRRAGHKDIRRTYSDHSRALGVFDATCNQAERITGIARPMPDAPDFAGTITV